MDKHSKDKLASGLMRGAVVSGLVSGLAAASLGGVPTASATCIGISGININLGDGGGCFTTVGSFALGLGPNTLATSAGLLTSAIAIGFGNEQTEITQATSFGFFSFAWAGGPDTLAETNGNANLAVMQGENGRTVVGAGTQFDNYNIAINVGNGFDTGLGFTTDNLTNTVGTLGQGNIAVNFFGDSIPGVNLTDRATWSVVQAGGLTVGLSPTGFANAAYNLFGDGNQVTVGDQASDFGLGFSVFGDRNDVVVNGPAAAGGALFQSDRFVQQTGPGIEIGGVLGPPPAPVTTLFNDTGTPTNVLAAGGTQGSRQLSSTSSNVLAASGTQRSAVRPSLNFTPGLNSTSNLRDQFAASNKKFGDQLQSSAKKFGDQLQSSAKKFNDRLAASVKKFSDSVNATRAGAKPDTASTNDSDSDSEK